MVAEAEYFDPFSEVNGRDIAALLNPRPVVIVGTCGRNEAQSLVAMGASTDPRVPDRAQDSSRKADAAQVAEVNFATVAWITPLSHDPAMIAFSLRRRSKTFELLQATRCCTISTLDASDPTNSELATYCGNVSGNTEDKAAQVAHKLITYTARKGNLLCAPLPNAALSWLACEVESIRPTGDHMLVCLRVHKAATQCGTDSKGRIAATRTLLCTQHDSFARII